MKKPTTTYQVLKLFKKKKKKKKKRKLTKS